MESYDSLSVALNNLLKQKTLVFPAQKKISQLDSTLIPYTLCTPLKVVLLYFISKIPIHILYEIIAFLWQTIYSTFHWI